MINSAKRNMWRERIEQCLSSGMSNSEWCLLNGVNQSTFYYWVSRFRKEEPNLFPAQNTSEWIEITKEALAARVAIVPATKGTETLMNSNRHDIETIASTRNTTTAAPVICARINGVELSISPGSSKSDIENVFKVARGL